jgi:hypothetical protein
MTEVGDGLKKDKMEDELLRMTPNFWSKQTDVGCH